MIKKIYGTIFIAMICLVASISHAKVITLSNHSRKNIAIKVTLKGKSIIACKDKKKRVAAATHFYKNECRTPIKKKIDTKSCRVERIYITYENLPELNFGGDMFGDSDIVIETRSNRVDVSSKNTYSTLWFEYDASSKSWIKHKETVKQ